MFCKTTKQRLAQKAAAKTLITKVTFNANGMPVLPHGSNLRLLDADVQLLVSREAEIQTLRGMARKRLAEVVEDVPDWFGQLGEGWRKVFLLYHGTTIIGVIVVDKTDVGGMDDVMGTEQGLVKALHHVRAYMVEEHAVGKHCGLALARTAVRWVAVEQGADFVTFDIHEGNRASYDCLANAAQTYGFTVQPLGVMAGPDGRELRLFEQPEEGDLVRYVASRNGVDFWARYDQ